MFVLVMLVYTCRPAEGGHQPGAALLASDGSTAIFSLDISVVPVSPLFW